MLILSIPIGSFGLNITTSVPKNVQTGDSVSVSLTFSTGDPSDFYLNMYCTNNGKTDDSVSDVANFTSDTTEDISIVSLGNCIIRALLHSEPDADSDTPIAESEPFDLRASSSESQSSSTGSASTDQIVEMINLALGATSFLGVLGIILYLFLQRTRTKPETRLNTKAPPNPDSHSPVIIVTPDQRLTFTSPKTLASDQEVRHLSLISRKTPDVPTAVRSLSLETSDPSLYSTTTTNENLTILSFPLPPAATQSELHEFVTRLRREASSRSPKVGAEESQGAGDVRLRRQIYGMRSEIAYLRAELDLAWALGFGSQAAPSIDGGSRRSEESGTLSVHSSAPQVSSNVA